MPINTKLKIYFQVSVLLSMVLSVHSSSLHDIRQAKEITQRRQFIGYSNNIVHENPNYPDQTAQSTVKVNFNPNQIEQRQQIYNNRYINQQDFSQDYTQTYPTNSPQSQLFNVGYSVSFTSNNNKQPSKFPSLPKYTRTNHLDNGEIITGTRKQNEEVQGPNINLSPQDYVSTALINSKKQKISGIKPKPHFITNYPNPKALLTQANLSPVTQKYYKTLEQLKPQVQNIQDLQQKYSWRNLSPGVEIIRSTEVPTVSQKFTRSDQSLHFDHAKALGRSQDFDYTNAVDNNIPQQTNLFYNHLKKGKLTSAQQLPSLAFANQNVPSKLPIDTTLLKEPIPIQVDTRLVEEAMRNQFGIYSNNKYTQDPVQDVSYFQQTYRTIPVHENIQNKQEIYQPEQPQGFQDYQSNQSRFQYKIYGKPQPMTGPFNEKQEEQQLQRQPRYLSDLSTNLRPPPFATVPYQRRIHVG
ncbi:hypothetical protein BDFB_005941 [Asbolus verrucosus]|uniref:Uncharacterized protein n=1 Tax=Asbolus verrucosus TaxID=1661398 RepID=A0A482VP21_ASBVE|nr:hypothetical protein BDFB_005941 [Asbolus verrucosus]